MSVVGDKNLVLEKKTKRITFDQYVGSRLRSIRKEQGKLIREVSEATGVSRSFLSDVENGKRGISIKMIFLLCDCYGKNLNYFVFGCKGLERANKE